MQDTRVCQFSKLIYRCAVMFFISLLSPGNAHTDAVDTMILMDSRIGFYPDD